MYKVIATTGLILFSTGLFSQKNDTIWISTSGVCQMCKERIEMALAYEKGVKKFEFFVENGKTWVVYQPQKTNPLKIKSAISKVGYDADEIPADPKAYSKLDPCCRKNGDHKEHH